MKKLLFVFLTALAMEGYSQQSLSLSDAVNTALKNSFDIRLAKNNLEISNINNNSGVAGALPVVSATAGDNEQLTTINQKYADAARDVKRNNVGSNNLTAGITGSILLYNGYRVVTTEKRLGELQRQNQQLLNAQIQNTIAAVSVKYYDIVRQQQLLQTILQSIEVSKQKLSILQVRKEAGLSNNADIYQAQLDLNTLVQSKLSQQLVIHQAKTDLLNLIVAKPDSSVNITDTIVVDRSIRLDNIRSALKDNPQLLSAASQVQINALIEKETAALRYPSLRANTGYNFNSNKSSAGFSLLNQSYGPFVGISLSIPIYNGSASKRQQQVAEINTRNALIQRDNLALSLEAGAVKTFQSYTNALEQLQTEQDNYRLSGQLMDLVLQRFQVGQATIVDVKLAQQSFEDAGYRLMNLNYMGKIAETELKRLSNQLAP
ncbi:TolC family protein [Asinibacterium sp. OR53]|uniref:TolC family protein n=1 Tax=Asinibacterium sp. OR53 TaxID=925409 RepID=UPI00047B9042|nr:TolC family protein [Asinibacterium sp. OR53]